MAYHCTQYRFTLAIGPGDLLWGYAQRNAKLPPKTGVPGTQFGKQVAHNV